MTTKVEFDALLENIREAERKTRQRTALLLVPSVLLAGSLLVFTGWRFAEYQRRVDEVTAEIAAKEKKIERLTEEVDRVQARLDRAISLGSYVVEFDWRRSKLVASRHPERGHLLNFIMEQKLDSRVRWHVDGTSPEEGFDSPNFAFFILRRADLLPPALADHDSGDVSSQILKDALPPTEQPRFGDLAFYPGGFVMFFFLDERNRPFVVGMTPLGLLALEPGFARPVEYRRVGQ